MKNRIVLVAAANWGIGHATRMIPLVQRLIHHGLSVHLASSGDALLVLRNAFPGFPFLALPDYRIRYPFPDMLANLLAGSGPLLQAIAREHVLLARYRIDNGVTALVSDARFGCFSRKVPSIYVTHQLMVRYPKSFAIERLARAIHLNFMRPFSAIWVPDWPGEDNLAGTLSAVPGYLQNRTRYIGPLSRMAQRPPAPILWDILAVLSGPEPQRSRLESILKPMLGSYPGRCLLIRGLWTSQRERSREGNLTVVNWLEAEDLAEAIGSAARVVCRPGYSTLMDLAALGKPALLIPTPGQTEQEYLAVRWGDKWGLHWAKQEELSGGSLAWLADEVKNFSPPPPEPSMLDAAIRELLQLMDGKHDA